MYKHAQMWIKSKKLKRNHEQIEISNIRFDSINHTPYFPIFVYQKKTFEIVLKNVNRKKSF